ncbi:CocE/NonD family hydrolase [Calothrix sp. 336/3]|uniref:CocE/NonD family hydrolase n=1 Tax=Calothrix sp. 336/3 TaxID=1337936 RepID=UPI0004E3CB38|nr:CocE/NonD family hydrolase [Calothrix sp. 336/3]AKG20835.1 S15 family X-Pro dipeptidyl-peptidase [Calothrix sp. 336/3]
MLTRDGVRLDADIYRPDTEGEFPVLLMRQPYGRAIASTVVYAHPTWYAAHGYIVVVQDVRGRGSSEGEFKAFSQEINDGEDTINWVANLPGSNGNVGMYGFSYQGMTQLYAAASKHPALKTICPAMVGYDLYTDWAYEGGAFCYQTNLAWAIQLATETAKRQGDERVYQALFTASRNLPIHNPELLKTFAPESFYHEWLHHYQPDGYWENISPRKLLQDVDLPMFHVGGWFDTYLRGTLNLYRDMAARSRYRQQILVGPWAHLPWGRKVGEVDFGEQAMSPVDKMQLCWFEQYLKGVNTGLFETPPVWLFEMGTNFWQGFSSFPSENQKTFYLSSSGLAGMREDEGKLTIFLPDSSTSDVIVHDPWRPVLALGGHAAIPAGVFERSHLDCRSDVLTYTTEPLKADYYLAGEVAVEVYASADHPSFDICAVVSELLPDGRVYNITQGYVNCQDGTTNMARKISLQSTCVRIAKGHALRLSLSASCFPAYGVNPGKGGNCHGVRGMDAQVITLTVNSGKNSLSRLLLPIVAFSEEVQGF